MRIFDYNNCWVKNTQIIGVFTKRIAKKKEKLHLSGLWMGLWRVKFIVERLKSIN